MCLDRSPVSPDTKMSLAVFHAPILAFSKEMIKGEKPRVCPKAGPGLLLSRVSGGGQWLGEVSRTVPYQQVSPRPRHCQRAASVRPVPDTAPK